MLSGAGQRLKLETRVLYIAHAGYFSFILPMDMFVVINLHSVVLSTRGSYSCSFPPYCLVVLLAEVGNCLHLVVVDPRLAPELVLAMVDHISNDLSFLTAPTLSSCVADRHDTACGAVMRGRWGLRWGRGGHMPDLEQLEFASSWLNWCARAGFSVPPIGISKGMRTS